MKHFPDDFPSVFFFWLFSFCVGFHWFPSLSSNTAGCSIKFSSQVQKHRSRSLVWFPGALDERHVLAQSSFSVRWVSEVGPDGFAWRIRRCLARMFLWNFRVLGSGSTRDDQYSDENTWREKGKFLRGSSTCNGSSFSELNWLANNHVWDMCTFVLCFHTFTRSNVSHPAARQTRCAFSGWIYIYIYVCDFH